jgi:hypothetical protein
VSIVALPRLSLLDAVVVPIALGDLSFLVLRLARSTLPLHGRFVPVKDCLLRERRLGWNEVRTLQLRRWRTGRSANSEDQQKLVREDGDLPISRSPRGEALGAAAPAAKSKMPSRSPAPRGAGSQVATGGSVRSRSPSRGLGQPSSRRDEAATSEAAPLLRHGTT